MKNTILILFFAILFFLSCTTDSIDNSNEENFYALKVGNSWVYKAYIIRDDAPDILESTTVVDSVAIIGTEEINNNIYYKFRRRTSGVEPLTAMYSLSIFRNGETFELLRDSIGYLVNDSGTIRYTNNDYEERQISFNQNMTIGSYAKLQEGMTTISTEAGNFECINTHTYIRNLDTNELFPALNYDYYSDKIGRISYTSSYVIAPFPRVVYDLDSYQLQ
jgi:hypothetical protein